MATDLTEAQQAHDRRAEEKEKELLEDFDWFSTWMKEEFSLTDNAAYVHEHLINDREELAGLMLQDMWETVCKAKAFEMTGE